eukprot:6472854-Amphidinium_carterae.2
MHLLLPKAFDLPLFPISAQLSMRYAIYLCTTDFLLHFDCDSDFQPASAATPWIDAAASYLSNSTALTGLWSIGLEHCAYHWDHGNLQECVSRHRTKSAHRFENSRDTLSGPGCLQE